MILLLPSTDLVYLNFNLSKSIGTSTAEELVVVEEEEEELLAALYSASVIPKRNVSLWWYVVSPLIASTDNRQYLPNIYSGSSTSCIVAPDVSVDSTLQSVWSVTALAKLHVEPSSLLWKLVLPVLWIWYFFNAMVWPISTCVQWPFVVWFVSYVVFSGAKVVDHDELAWPSKFIVVFTFVVLIPSCLLL